MRAFFRPASANEILSEAELNCDWDWATSAATRSWIMNKSTKACCLCPSRSLMSARLPSPKFFNSHKTAAFISKRLPPVNCPFTPADDTPPRRGALFPLAPLLPCNKRLGMKGRIFSCFSFTSVACTKAWFELNSGLLVRPNEIKPSTGWLGDISINAKCGGSTGTTCAIGFNLSNLASSALETFQSLRACTAFSSSSASKVRERSISTGAAKPLLNTSVFLTSSFPLVTVSIAPANLPRDCCTLKYATATSIRASFLAGWISCCLAFKICLAERGS